MEVTFDGQGVLLDFNRQIQDLFDNHYRDHHRTQATHATETGDGEPLSEDGYTLAVPNYSKTPELKLNQIYAPTGATRYDEAWILVRHPPIATNGTIGHFGQFEPGYDRSRDAKKLVIYDRLMQRNVTFHMHAIEVIKLIPDNSDSPFLVHLVGPRYWWQNDSMVLSGYSNKPTGGDQLCTPQLILDEITANKGIEFYLSDDLETNQVLDANSFNGATNLAALIENIAWHIKGRLDSFVGLSTANILSKSESNSELFQAQSRTHLFIAGSTRQFNITDGGDTFFEELPAGVGNDTRSIRTIHRALIDGANQPPDFRYIHRIDQNHTGAPTVTASHYQDIHSTMFAKYSNAQWLADPQSPDNGGDLDLIAQRALDIQLAHWEHRHATDSTSGINHWQPPFDFTVAGLTAGHGTASGWTDFFTIDFGTEGDDLKQTVFDRGEKRTINTGPRRLFQTRFRSHPPNLTLKKFHFQDPGAFTTTQRNGQARWIIAEHTFTTPLTATISDAASTIQAYGDGFLPATWASSNTVQVSAAGTYQFKLEWQDHLGTYYAHQIG